MTIMSNFDPIFMNKAQKQTIYRRMKSKSAFKE